MQHEHDGKDRFMPNFNVVVLGPSGSGKSTFLGSMHEVIGSQRLSDNIFVRADPATKNRLAGIYRTMSDTSQGWPVSNHCDDMIELSFTGFLDSDPEPLKLYEARYLDYDGRCLTDQQTDVRIRKNLAGKIKAADAVLCILDGEYIVDLLHKKPRGRRFFEHDMEAVWGHVSACKGPLHFVVTKWDLVEQYGSLDEVRDALTQVSGFASAVHRALGVETGLGGRRIVRLIPISAVGTGFAEPGSDGTMTKVPQSTTAPLNVSFPFIALLPDVLQTAIQDAEKEAARATNSGFLRKMQINLLGQVLARTGAQKAVQEALTRAPQWSSAALSKLGQFAHRNATDKLGRLIANHGIRISEKSIKHAGPIALGLVLLAEVAIEALRDSTEKPIDPEALRRYGASLDQAVRAYKLELDRFRERYPASHLADLDSPRCSVTHRCSR